MDCNGNCSACSENCGNKEKQDLHIPLNEMSSVKKVIAVVSGKGGVGKSLVTSMLAVTAQTMGKQAAVLNIIMERMESRGLKLDVKLKELLGHTPIEVGAGALLGFVIAIIFFLIN